MPTATPVPTPTLVPLDLATTRWAPIIVAIANGEYEWLEAYIDVADDYDQYDIDVFIETVEFCNTTRVYGDESFYKLSCALFEFSSHTDVERVSVQTPVGDLKCARNQYSDDLLSVFACDWR